MPDGGSPGFESSTNRARQQRHRQDSTSSPNKKQASAFPRQPATDREMGAKTNPQLPRVIQTAARTSRRWSLTT